MRRRPSARLLLLDPDRRVLLFRFVHKTGPLAGKDFWATPGGGVEAGESFADAAIRELLEETGIAVDTVGEPEASRQFVMQMPDGENVIADERLFVVHVSDSRLSRAGWTALEEDVMAEHRWWPSDELRNTSDTVWPSDIPEILAEAGSCSK